MSLIARAAQAAAVVVLAGATLPFSASNSLAVEDVSTVGGLIIADPPPVLDANERAVARAAKEAAERCDAKKYEEVVRQAGFRLDGFGFPRGQGELGEYLRSIRLQMPLNCEYNKRVTLGQTTFILNDLRGDGLHLTAIDRVQRGMTAEAIEELRKALARAEEDAQKFSTATDETGRRQAAMARRDAATLRILIDQMSARLPLPPGTQPPRSDPGRGPVWTPPPWSPGERLRHMFFGLGAMGGNLNVPSFGAGTQFVAALGREVQILASPRNLTFAGGMAELRIPATQVFGSDVRSPFSQMAFYARLGGFSFWGSESATVPIGGNNVAYTFLFPNPATTTTGILAGASGQQISIKAEGEGIKFRAGAEWQLWTSAQVQAFEAFFSGGLAFDYMDTGYKITQQSLFFQDVSTRTKLRIDDYFVAPYFEAGARLDDGKFYASVSGFVAPGAVITDASAKQRIRCGPCVNPGDRDVRLSRSFNESRFAVQAGFNLKVGTRITPAISLEGSFGFVHSSQAAFIRPPTTPSEQPVRLDYGSRNSFGGGVVIRYRF